MRSPRIGARLRSNILVTADHADGEVGFAATAPIEVQEPSGNVPHSVSAFDLKNSFLFTRNKTYKLL